MNKNQSFIPGNPAIQVAQPTMDPRTILGLQMKSLKKELPKECSHIAPYRNYLGNLLVRVIVNGEEYLYTIPENLVFKRADLDELKNQILSKCEGNVSQGD